MKLIIVEVIITNGIGIIVILDIYNNNNNNNNVNEIEMDSLVSLIDETQPSWNR